MQAPVRTSRTEDRSARCDDGGRGSEDAVGPDGETDGDGEGGGDCDGDWDGDWDDDDVERSWETGRQRVAKRAGRACAPWTRMQCCARTAGRRAGVMKAGMGRQAKGERGGSGAERKGGG